MKIGLLGGSFDPPHNAHLAMAQAAQKQLSLDRVIFVPAGQPPHKKEVKLTDADLRIQMVRAATEHNPFFQVSDLEIKRKGPSYTIDTLSELKKKFPEGTEFFLIIGSDSLREFSTWHEWKKITQLAKLLVAPRKGAEVEKYPPFAIKLELDPVETSATQIRQWVGKKAPIRDWVPQAVWELIDEYGLYQKS
jgi:nicotinate-nucleotide adenylyltransferase